MDRRIVLHGGLLTTLIAAFVTVAVVRSARPPARPESPSHTPSRAPAPTPPKPIESTAERPEPARNPDKLPAALRDATLKTLIQNAKVGQIRGDARTRDAMVSGLKREPGRSRDLIKLEIESAPDYASATALRQLMEALQ